MGRAAARATAPLMTLSEGLWTRPMVQRGEGEVEAVRETGWARSKDNNNNTIVIVKVKVAATVWGRGKWVGVHVERTLTTTLVSMSMAVNSWMMWARGRSSVNVGTGCE